VSYPPAPSKMMPSNGTKMICVTSTPQTILRDHPCFIAEALDRIRLKAEVQTKVYAH